MFIILAINTVMTDTMSGTTITRRQERRAASGAVGD